METPGCERVQRAQQCGRGGVGAVPLIIRCGGRGGVDRGNAVMGWSDGWVCCAQRLQREIAGAQESLQAFLLAKHNPGPGSACVPSSTSLPPSASQLKHTSLQLPLFASMTTPHCSSCTTVEKLPDSLHRLAVACTATATPAGLIPPAAAPVLDAV